MTPEEKVRAGLIAELTDDERQTYWAMQRKMNGLYIDVYDTDHAFLLHISRERCREFETGVAMDLPVQFALCLLTIGAQEFWQDTRGKPNQDGTFVHVLRLP